jgi:hypothetical protein
VPKYSVYTVTSMSLVVEAESPEAAARYARERILGLLSTLPTDFYAIGFEPSFKFRVRQYQDGRSGLVLLKGTDQDLNPR